VEDSDAVKVVASALRVELPEPKTKTFGATCASSECLGELWHAAATSSSGRAIEAERTFSDILFDLDGKFELRTRTTPVR
jgi:hypothetical protein